MVYKNQYYMTNRKIKEEVDKNQKDYQPEEEKEEVTETTIKATFIVTINKEGYEGATVTIGSLSKTTDQNGVAIFEGLPNENAVASITSDEFSEITRNIVKDEKEQLFNVDIVSFQVETPTMTEEEVEW